MRATTMACCGTLARPVWSDTNAPTGKTVVAAVQYAPVLGDVDSNISRARSMVLEAIKEGARWIVLPEFFTSGLAMHPLMFDAARPIDGSPTRFLTQMATKHDVYIGGSFLALNGRDIFNTFVLATPNGKTMTHDKDFPSTDYESSFYAGGEDQAYAEILRKNGAETRREIIQPRSDNTADGVFVADEHRVGVALCWELVRYRTARRLIGKIEMLLGASGWWWSSPEFGWPGLAQEVIVAGRRELQQSKGADGGEI